MSSVPQKFPPSSLPQVPGIYRIRNLINGHHYIGSTVNLRKRRHTHFRDLFNNKHRNDYLQKAFNHYGMDAFAFEIIELVECKEHLIAREQFYLDLHSPEYNLSPIAGSQLGLKFSEESKKRLSLVHMGQSKGPFSEDHKRRISEANRGREFSQEHIEKLKKSHLGKSNGPHSEETKRKMSEAKKGKKLSQERRDQISATQKANPAFAEHCRKLAEAQRGVPLRPEHAKKILESKARNAALRAAKPQELQLPLFDCDAS